MVERLQRIIRDALSKVEAVKRINAQKGNGFYEKNCDAVIDNNGTQEELSKNLDRVLSGIL